ncbi:MAG: hypothetical protein AVDCRST_MAG87-2367 [uncultured Thermomicrobiales bacterium]|uniref:Uncharacterized protein n=1 Tax=uncultured Thermomicrobiales bacterium TaxID=1645740 RepID=A0A6J4VCW6_9BACT|nr:MAG: hypothetical protein AVDCRST_MAG87-2367 [uncultured Thermomicrobiales bacterium]
MSVAPACQRLDRIDSGCMPGMRLIVPGTRTGVAPLAQDGPTNGAVMNRESRDD